MLVLEFPDGDVQFPDGGVHPPDDVNASENDEPADVSLQKSRQLQRAFIPESETLPIDLSTVAQK